MKTLKLALLTLMLTLVSAAAFALPGSDSAGTVPENLKNPREIVFIHGLFVTPKCWEQWEAYFKSAGYQVTAPLALS